MSQLHAVEAVQLGVWKQLLRGIDGISLLLERLEKTHLNALCIAVSERDIIVQDLVVYRISEGRIVHGHNLLALHEAHLKDALAESTRSTDSHDDGLLPGL